MEDKFGVKVRVYRGSVLNPLLFIIVLEPISRKCRSSPPLRKMLYADDLVIIAESLEKLGKID